MQRYWFLFLLLVAGISLGQSNNRGAVPIDTEHSRLMVTAFKTGLFSGLAHDHEIAAPISSGSIDVQNRQVELEVSVPNMKVLDPKLAPDKRAEVQSTMLSNEVLDAARYPTIRFASRHVEQGADGAYTVQGDLTLHGVTKPVSMQVRLDGERYIGKATFPQTDFGIKPVSVAGGTVKVKDVVEITFDVTAKRGL